MMGGAKPSKGRKKKKKVVITGRQVKGFPAGTVRKPDGTIAVPLAAVEEKKSRGRTKRAATRKPRVTATQRNAANRQANWDKLLDEGATAHIPSVAQDSHPNLSKAVNAKNQYAGMSFAEKAMAKRDVSRAQRARTQAGTTNPTGAQLAALAKAGESRERQTAIRAAFGKNVATDYLAYTKAVKRLNEGKTKSMRKTAPPQMDAINQMLSEMSINRP